MKTKHTPGPWEAGKAKSGAWGVWTLPGFYYVFDSSNNGEANARLIAAAPEMLTALRMALSTLNYMTSEEFSHGKDKRTRELLAAVIAKAEG